MGASARLFGVVVWACVCACLPGEAWAQGPDGAAGDKAKAEDAAVPTESQFMRDYHAFLSETLLKVFDEAHPAPTPDDVEARKYVGSLAAHVACQWSKTMSRHDMVFGTHELVKRKYEDPMLLLAAAYYLNIWNDHGLAAARLWETEADVPNTPEGVVGRILILRELATAHSELNSTRAQEDAARKGVDAVIAGVRSGIFKDRSRYLVRLLHDTIDNGVWPAPIAATLCDKLDAIEDADPWLKHTLRGLVEIELAWEARGGAYAHKVTAKGWEGFEEHLVKARKQLVRAYELHPERPEPATLMIPIAMAGHAGPDETERFWFDRVKKAEIDCWRAHGSMRWALRPRWSGSLEEMYQFGMECAASRRFDTCVPFQFILTLKDLGDETEDIASVMTAPGALENAKRILRSYMEEPEDTIAWNRARADLIVVHWAAGEYKDAREQLEAYGENLSSGELKDWGIALGPVAFSDEIYLFGSSVAKRVRTADALLEEGEYVDAARGFSDASREIGDLDAPVTAALHRRLEVARVNAALEVGEPVTFSFLPGLPGWSVYTSSWTVVDDTSIKMTAKSSSPLLRMKYDVGERYEVSAHIELPEKTNGLFGAGIVVGLGEKRNESRWHVASIRGSFGKTRSIHVGACNLNGRGQSFSAGLEVKPGYDLTVKVWDEQLAVYVDGAFVFAGHVEISDEELEWGPRIGLGMFGERASGEATISSVRTVRLKERPAEFEKAQVLKLAPPKTLKKKPAAAPRWPE